MQIIAAYPCLGKTTIYSLNKDKCFDREFNESRTCIDMTEESIDAFFTACAKIIELQYKTNYYKIMFITENDKLIEKLEDTSILKSNIILVFPDAFDIHTMTEYKKRVINRSGQLWWDRVIEPQLSRLQNRIVSYENSGYDVRLTHSYEYIEDVVKIPDYFMLPKRVAK